MSYKENEVVAKYTKGNNLSDCGEYNVNDLLEMFDKTEITVDELGNTDGVTVNDCIENDLVTKSLVVTTECDDMFCYYNNDNLDVMGSFDENGDAVECSLELDYEFQYQSE
ncbi:MAG: hypothetical protein H8D84_02540 [Proteobacteria bacterium]|nr:hypothetical protein [Pseudomonadota bacterium]